MEIIKKRKRQIRNINSVLLSPIIELILSKLPFFNLPNCRLVCKQWNDLIVARKFDSRISISNLVFAHRFSNLLCVEFDHKLSNPMRTVASFKLHPNMCSRGKDFSIVNSCNGLLFFLIKKFSRKGGITRRSVCILNPMTNEYFELGISRANRKEKYFYGLGFGPKTKQYKIARSTMVSDRSGTLIEIFTCTSREWTRVMFVPSFSPIHSHVYFDGGLYIVGVFVNKEDYKEDYVTYRLDVESGIIKEISFPQGYGDYCRIGDVNGTLYLTTFVDNEDMFRVWRIGEDCSWIETFVFPLGSLGSFDIQLIKVYERGEILYLADELGLLLYRPKSTTKKVLMKMKSVHEIGSINFNSLPKILTGNC